MRYSLASDFLVKGTAAQNSDEEEIDNLIFEISSWVAIVLSTLSIIACVIVFIRQLKITRQRTLLVRRCIIWLTITDAMLAATYVINTCIYTFLEPTAPDYYTAPVYIVSRFLMRYSYECSAIWSVFVTVAVYLSLPKPNSRSRKPSIKMVGTGSFKASIHQMDTNVNGPKPAWTPSTSFTTRQSPINTLAPEPSSASQAPASTSTSPSALSIEGPSVKKATERRIKRVYKMYMLKYEIAFHFIAWILPFVNRATFLILQIYSYQDDVSDDTRNLIAGIDYLWLAGEGCILTLVVIGTRVILLSRVKQIFKSHERTFADSLANRKNERQILLKLAQYSFPFLICNTCLVFYWLLLGILKIAKIEDDQVVFRIVDVFYYFTNLLFPLQGLLNALIYTINSKTAKETIKRAFRKWCLRTSKETDEPPIDFYTYAEEPPASDHYRRVASIPAAVSDSAAMHHHHHNSSDVALPRWGNSGYNRFDS